MPRPGSQRVLIRSAAIGLGLWLAVVVALTLWRYPRFWETPQLQFDRAQRLAAAGNFEASLAAADSALARVPANPNYLVFKGYRQLDLKDPASAEETFRRALRVAPTDLEAGLGFASALQRQGKRGAALSALDALQTKFASPAHLRRRSQLYGILGAHAAALQDALHLLESQPSSPELLKEAATYAAALRDWPRAEVLAVQLEIAASNDATRRWAAEMRSNARRGAGEAPVPPRPESPAYTLLARGRQLEAAVAFRDLVATGAADAQARATYAWLLNSHHRYAEAWQVIEPLPKPARDPRLLELQARTALWAGRHADAVPLVHALLSIRPQDADLWKQLASAAQALGDDRQAADAYRAYLRLEAQDWQARQELGRILARLGSLDLATAEYQTLALARPWDPAVLVSLGLLQESAGNLEAAKATYLRAISAMSTASPELLLRMARLYRWTSQPAQAPAWYGRYLAAVADPPLRRQAEAELALSLLDAGRSMDSLVVIESVGARMPLNAEELLMAARAATAARYPGMAARYLERLGALRALSREEEAWLAGQYRAAGQSDAALRLYDRLSEGTTDAAILEAAADLKFDAGDYRGSLDLLRRIGADHDVLLKIARTAARAGDLTTAFEGYQRVVAAHPAASDARLEAARFFANAGRPELAVAAYSEVILIRGPGGLRLEMARVALAAGDFATAEQWARQALAAGEDPDETRLTLAQSLHLLGRSRDADAVLAEITPGAPPYREALAWQGRVSAALDRHLAAYRSFSRAIAWNADHGERLTLWIGTAAQKRKDYSRALEWYRNAASRGATPAEVSAALHDVGVATHPRVNLPVWSHADSHDLRLVLGGAGFLVPLPGLVGMLEVTGSGGTLRQDSFRTHVSRASIALSQVFPTPELELGGRLAIEEFSRASRLISWAATANYSWSDERSMGFVASREPLLPFNPPPSLRQFNRVLDVGALGPGFYVDSLRALADARVGGNPAHVESGAGRFADGNRHLFAYAHYQLPLSTASGRWTVLRPNLFVESFSNKQPFYFSPSRHTTLGVMLHTIRDYQHWNLEVEVNPQLLYTEGRSAFGGHGLVNLVFKSHGTTMAAGTFVFYDSLEDYLQWRLGGRVSVPLKW